MASKCALTDSSARFYPIMATRRYQSLFCFTVKMEEDIDAARLERAVNEALDSCPMYRVRLKKRFSWHSFDDNTLPFRLSSDEGLLSPIDFEKNNGYLFRIRISGKTLVLDIFHALTDGTGALKLLKAILAAYAHPAIVDREEAELFEDVFSDVGKPIPLSELALGEMAGEAPYRISGTFLKDGLKSHGAAMPTGDIMDRAKRAGVSFTAYVLGHIARSVDNMSDGKRPIVLMVPVNLRKVFKRDAMRNFTLFARVVIRPESCKTLDDYIREAKDQLEKKTSRKALEKQCSSTVKGMNIGIMKLVPLWLKAFFMKIGRAFMKSRQTMIFSNLGVVDLDGLGVEEISLNLNVSKNNVQNISAITLKGVTRLTCTSAIEELTFPNGVYNGLIDEGVHLRFDTL